MAKAKKSSSKVESQPSVSPQPEMAGDPSVELLLADAGITVLRTISCGEVSDYYLDTHNGRYPTVQAPNNLTAQQTVDFIRAAL